MLTLSEHFSVGICKLLAHPIDLIVRTAVLHLNLSFALEVCAAFYCQNSLTGGWICEKPVRMETLGWSLSPSVPTSKIPIKCAPPLAEIPWLLGELPNCSERWGKAGVPLAPANSYHEGLSLHFLSLKALPEQSSGISALFWIIYLFIYSSSAVLWLCCLILC